MKQLTGWLFFITMLSFLQAQPVLEFTELTLSGPTISSPVDLTGSGDGSGRLFVVEKAGYIKIIDGSTVLGDDFLDIHSKVASGGERGLLGLAFHPGFPSTPYLYVHYIKPDIDESGAVPDTSIIARFTVNPGNANDALEGSELLILKRAQPYTNHNSGDLAFGPNGYLYIPFGDGGSAGDPEESGQDSLSLLGKLLRIDVDDGSPYGIPENNPYTDNPNILDEIWAFGLRNPWRISFDCVTGDLWIGDVGQGTWEEVNFEQAGSPGGVNYGWDCYEGNHAFELTGCQGASNYTTPVFEYPHNCNQGCPLGTGNSITGGFVYRGANYPSLQGYYITADYGSENVWLISPTFNVSVQSGSGIFNQLASFGEGDDKELYAVMLDGRIFSVGVQGVLPLYFTAFYADRMAEDVRLRWKIEQTDGLETFEIQRSSTAFTAFKTIGSIQAEAAHTTYLFVDQEPLKETMFYRIKGLLDDGSEEFSSMLSVPIGRNHQGMSVYTTSDGQLVVRSPIFRQNVDVSVFSMDGKLVLSRKVDLLNDRLISGTAGLQSALYVVVVTGDAGDQMSIKWIKQQ